MKNIAKPTILTALMLLLSSSAYAASIGVSFLGDTDLPNPPYTSGWVLAPADVAGVVPQAFWNNLNSSWGAANPPFPGGYVGNADSLFDDAGNITIVQLQYVAGDAWNSSYVPGLDPANNAGPTTNANEKLMKGVIKTDGPTYPPIVLTFSNLPPAASYDVYVYGAVDSGPGNLKTSIGATTNYWTEPEFFTDDGTGSGFINATSTNPSNPGAGNYCKFAGVTPAGDGTITITASDTGGSVAGIGIAGVQVISAAAFPTNTTPVAITSQPQDTTAVVGWPASFVVQAGPLARSFQWYSNDVVIAGATLASYTTPPVTLGNNGDKYKVRASNNISSTNSDEATLTVVTDPGTRVASIGASFLGDSSDGNTTPWVLNPADEAGVVAQTNWSNINSTPTGDVGISAPFSDSAGNYTAVQLQFVANDAWNSDGTDLSTPNDKLMKGILKEGNGVVGSSMTLTFTNLPFAIYDVYVYGNVNGGPVDLDVSIEGITNYWTEPAAFDDGTGFIEAASSDPSARAAGNYVKFAGATPVSGGITVTATYRGGSDGLGVAGLQLVSSAAFPTNTTPVAIIRQPQPTLAATGRSATFAVQVSGPFASFQWFSNSVAISGATSASYSTPPVSAGNNGDKYKVVVFNNVNSVTSYEVPLIVGNDPGTRVAQIGASFLGDDGNGGTAPPWWLAPTKVAGVVPQANWNNITNLPYGNVGISAPLVDTNGNLTAVQLQFVANDAWNADGPITNLDGTLNADDALMKGVLKQDGGSMTLAFWNLAPAFYDVYVYGDVDGIAAGTVELNVSLGTTTYDWIEPNVFDEAGVLGGGVLGCADASADPNGIGNYVKFTGVTPVSGGITVTATYIAGGLGGLGIAGLQIVSSAAFPTDPMVTAALQGGQLVVSWNSALTFQLQYRTELGPGSWTDEPTPPVFNGNQATVRLAATGPARFFRLVSR